MGQYHANVLVVCTIDLYIRQHSFKLIFETIFPLKIEFKSPLTFALKTINL